MGLFLEKLFYINIEGIIFVLFSCECDKKIFYGLCVVLIRERINILFEIILFFLIVMCEGIGYKWDLLFKD